MLWHNIWKDNGSPKEGLIANIRRQTRARYHLEVKKLNKDSDKVRADKMANAVLQKDTKNFWNEVKRVRNTNPILPGQIDGQCGSENISKIVAHTYYKIYNSVSYDAAEM